MMKQPQADTTKEKLLDEFDSVIAETERLLKSVATSATDKTASWRASVEGNLAAAGERLARLRERSMKQAGAAAHATDQFVQDNPWRVAGAAAALGALAGVLVGILIARR